MLETKKTYYQTLDHNLYDMRVFYNREDCQKFIDELAEDPDSTGKRSIEQVQLTDEEFNNLDQLDA